MTDLLMAAVMPMVPQTPIVKFFSPQKSDQGLIELHDTTTAAYLPLDLGVPHANTRDYAGFKLGKQFNVPNDHRWIMRIWVTDETGPQFWNWAEKFSGEANTFPIFIREFREPRNSYAPKTKGQPLKSVYKLTLTAAGTGYTPGTLPALAFSGGGGSGAAGHAVVNQDGTIAELVLDSGGDNYTSAPTFTVAAPPTGATATGTALIQPATALLVTEEAQQFPTDSEFFGLYLRVVRVYETLPGPYIPFTRYDQNLGPIQGRRRAVLNSGQVTTLGATSKKTYEGRDASSIVSWEIEENWSDGTGSAGNPAYPILKTDFYDDERGAVHQTSQITTDTTSAGSLTAPSATATKTRYEPYQENPALRKKIVETWTVPGPVQTSTEFDKDGVKKVVTRQQMKVGDIVTTETLATGTLTRKFKERLNEILGFQIIETITVDSGDLLDLPSFTTSIPNLIPEIFRAQIPLHVESHIVEGTAAETALVLGEFEHTERQLTPLYMEVRSTVLDDIGSLPITITGQKETNDKKQVVTVSMKLCLDTTTPTVPTALIDVDFKKLGNGLAIEITKTIPSVFDADTRSIEIPDVTPAWAKALLPTTSASSEAAATSVSDPTLSTGQIRKRVQRTTEKTVQTEIAARDTASLPKTRTNKKMTTEFGGAVIDEVQTQAVGAQTPSSGGLMVTDSEVEILGDGTSVLSTKTAEDASWPVLTSSLFDEEMRIQYPETRQVIAAGTAIGTIADNTTNEIKALDKWRSVRIITTKTPTAVDVASALISYEMRPYTYPARLDIDLFRSAGMLVPLPQLNIGFQEPSATLARVKVRTWWETSATAPNVSEDNILPSVVVITHPSLAGLYKFATCIHNAFTLPGTVAAYTYPASTPDYTTFVASWIGAEKIIGAIVEPAKEKNLWKVVTRSIVMR